MMGAYDEMIIPRTITSYDINKIVRQKTNSKAL